MSSIHQKLNTNLTCLQQANKDHHKALTRNVNNNWLEALVHTMKGL